MKNRSYYSFSDPDGNTYTRCSISSDLAPIIVNCAGEMQTSFPFTTDIPGGRHDYYLMYIRKGELSVSMPGGEIKASAGSAVIFPPHYHYSYSFSGGELTYLWCHFTGSDAASLLSEIGFYPLPAAREIGHDSFVSGEFEKIFSHFSENTPLRPRMLGCALEGMLLFLAKSMQKDEKPQNPLWRSIGHINEYYTKKLSVPELARMENLSNSRFYVLFCEHVGMPPSAYIKKLRMQNACELLLTTDLSVKQIGLSVGYDDPHFFSKLFKDQFTLSPSDYRKRFG